MSQQRVDLGVSLPAIGALLCFLGAFLALAACRGADRGHAEPLPSVDPTAERSLGDAPGVQGARQRAWLEAADIALERPTPVELPHAEWGGFLGQEPNARGIAFTADAGQILEINVARADAATPSGAIDVELFLVDTRGAGESSGARDVRLAQLPAGDSSLRFRLPLEATYVVRLKPAPLTDAIYFLQLELGAALPFPVHGYEVKSFFGAPRDQGRRHHEGIDIYAPRRTPVLAVADGQATYRENRLGGHTVWLATATGVSYYYAHLERVAVGSGQRVRTGDVLGYVGDSGNAAEVGPHLHFGIYRWGQGAVDPLPMLEAREFAPRSAGDAPREIAKLAAAGCAGRPAATLTPFKRCTAAELLKQRPYSVTDGTCPEVAPPCLRMAEAVEPPPLGASGSMEIERASAKPFAVQLAAAATLELELDRDLRRPGSVECYPSERQGGNARQGLDALPGLCAARPSQRVMMF